MYIKYRQWKSNEKVMYIKYRQWNSKLTGILEKENKQGSRTYTKIHYLGKLCWFKKNENYVMTQN